MTKKIINSCLGLYILTFLINGFSDNAQGQNAFKSLIFVIHEDGPYDYYEGNKKKCAAKQTAKKAKQIAENIYHGEVFIFRQKPIEKSCFCLCKKTYAAYYYLNGRLIEKQRYNRELFNSNFEIESNFYSLHSQSVSKINKDYMHIFYYFGAPIPEIRIPGYSNSIENKVFSSEEFFEGLTRFTDTFKEKFDAIILASGYSSTPRMVSKSLDISNYLVASAGPLSNVSYDLTELSNLDESTFEHLPILLKKIIDSSFTKLKEKSLEEIAINLFEREKIRPLLTTISSEYEDLLSTFSKKDYRQKTFIDCYEHPRFLSHSDKESFFKSSEIELGVYRVFRKAFEGWGHQHKKSSGWICPINQGS